MSIQEIKYQLLDKVISIKNHELLERIDNLIGNIDLEENIFRINDDQRMMLEKSEQDITNQDVIIDEELNKEEDKWLNG